MTSEYMAPELRLTLIFVSVLALVYIIRKIRHSKMNISDSIFWIVFAVLLILISVFPIIIFFFAKILGIQSPQNFLFLLMIGILTFKVFTMSIKISQLQDKLTALVQKIAIHDFEKDKEDSL
jgi:hypothetical protein